MNTIIRIIYRGSIKSNKEVVDQDSEDIRQFCSSDSRLTVVSLEPEIY